MTGDENDGDAVTAGDQPVLQVDAAQSRHSQIAYEARYVVDLVGFEKFVGRGKRGSLVAQRAHERFCPVADGFVVIDDRNYWNIRHKSDIRAGEEPDGTLLLPIFLVWFFNPLCVVNVPSCHIHSALIGAIF
jgi:hypothetical protein